MTLRRFFSTTPRRCGRRTWTTRTTPTTPTPTETTTTTMKNNNNNNNNISKRLAQGWLGCIYYIFYFGLFEKRLRRRRRRQRVRGTREEVYASEKTFSGEFKGEKFRTREWLHPEEFRRERDSVRDESVRRRRDDGRRGNGATRVEVVRAVRRRYGRESETGFDVVVDEKGNDEEDGFPETAEEKLQI